MNARNDQTEDRRKDRAELPMEAARKQLEHVAREGGFKAALLTTEDGFAVVDIESNMDSNALAALSGFAWRMHRNVQDLIGFDGLDQITLNGSTGDSLIFQAFTLLDQPVVLTVIARSVNPYRKLTDKAVEGIKRILL